MNFLEGHNNLGFLTVWHYEIYYVALVFLQTSSHGLVQTLRHKEYKIRVQMVRADMTLICVIQVVTCVFLLWLSTQAQFSQCVICLLVTWTRSLHCQRLDGGEQREDWTLMVERFRMMQVKLQIWFLPLDSGHWQLSALNGHWLGCPHGLFTGYTFVFQCLVALAVAKSAQASRSTLLITVIVRMCDRHSWGRAGERKSSEYSVKLKSVCATQCLGQGQRLGRANSELYLCHWGGRRRSFTQECRCRMPSSYWLRRESSGPMSGMERDTHKANISVN